MSIESDICRITSSECIQESLFKIGVLSDTDEEFSIVPISDWQRSGAETYSYVFDVVGARSQRLILKACVALAIGRSIDDVIRDWVNRRSVLESKNIHTPKLFGYGQGTILEEYIFHDLDKALRASSRPEVIASELGVLAAVLASLGFQPTQPFCDLRSRGSDVVVVDFGEDLGHPGNCLTSKDMESMLNSLSDTVRRWDIEKGVELERVASESFWRYISSI